MRLAHISDLHVLSLDHVGVSRFLNKRITGYANIRFRRGHIHHPDNVRMILREIARLKIDHVAITGDLTNLALEVEFEAVRDMLKKELGFSDERVSIVPGNHDFYTRGAQRSGRFLSYFGGSVTSDFPQLGGDPFPFVRVRGPIVIVGINTALARGPLVASGRVGRAQLDLLSKILSARELERKTPVILSHHPIYNPTHPRKRFMTGLEDAELLGDVLRGVGEGLLLHGHLHLRAHRTLTTDTGRLNIIGATSASLHHDDEHRMAGFNVYQFAANGFLSSVEAHVIDSSSKKFRVREIPKTALAAAG